MARPRRSQASRERLLEVGISSLLRDGYHGTGLKAVLDRSAVPKGSFYNFFTSKEDFAVAAIERYAECLGAQLEASLAGAVDALARVDKDDRATHVLQLQPMRRDLDERMRASSHTSQVGI